MMIIVFPKCFEGLKSVIIRDLPHYALVKENLPSNSLDNHLPSMDLNPLGENIANLPYKPFMVLKSSYLP